MALCFRSSLCLHGSRDAKVNSRSRPTIDCGVDSLSHNMLDTSEYTSLAHAQETFESAVRESVLGPKDPALIANDIAYLRGFFSQLQFQYLEQEARDKFISFLLSKDAASVRQADVDELIVQNSGSQKELQHAESELEALLSACRVSAEDVIAMSKKWELQKADADLAFAEHADLQKELSELAGAPGNEGYTMLLELNKMMGSYEVAPEEAVRIAQNDLQEDRSMLDRLAHTEGEYTAGVASRDKLVTELTAHLLQLQRQLDRPEPLDRESDPEQARAQSLRSLNALLAKLAARPVEVVHTEGKYTLVCGKEAIVFDEELRVLEAPVFLRNSVEKSRVNCIRGLQRVHVLLTLLDRVVLE